MERDSPLAAGQANPRYRSRYSSFSRLRAGPRAPRRTTVRLCGGGEIRTHETISGPIVFKTIAIDHSATPPKNCETVFPASGRDPAVGGGKTVALNHSAISPKNCETVFPASGRDPVRRGGRWQDCCLQPLDHLFLYYVNSSW